MTFGTDRLTSITTQQHSVLDLILILFHDLKESINADLLVHIESLFGWQAVPEHILLFLGEFVIRFENRESIFRRTFAKLVFPYPHPFAMPALHAPVIHTQCGVGDHQLLINTDNAAKSLAFGARAEWGIEREHIVVGFFKVHAIGFEACGKVIRDIRGQKHQPTFAVAFIQSCFSGIYQARHRILRIVHRHTVDEQPEVIGLHIPLMCFEKLIDTNEVIACPQS